MLMRVLLHAAVAMAVFSGLGDARSLMTWTPLAEAGVLRGDAVLWRAAAMDGLRLIVAEQNVELAESADGPIALGAGATRILLSPAAAALAQSIRMLPGSDHVYLVLQGIDTDVPPGVTYNVYLGLPDAAAPSGPADPHYVGTLSFFNAGRSRDAVFDVTDKIKALGETERSGNGLAVTVIPAGSPESVSKPIINKVLLLATRP
jgi:tyrosinase